MSAFLRAGIDDLSLDQVRQFDEICCRFESLWRDAPSPERRPQIEAFVEAAPGPTQSLLLSELVALEIQLRQIEGDRPLFDDYRGRFPMLSTEAGPTIVGGAGRSVRVDSAPIVIPGYEIIEELGRGGSAVVYKARHARLQRLVALKVIIAGRHAGPEAVERFRVEAEAVARLQHPHIVQIHEVGSHAGHNFIALEFCPGGSLDKKLKQSLLPPRPAAELVEKLARAMSAVHEKGVLHRDLKPANILLAEDGAPKITDFGLAKNTELGIDARASAQLTLTNTIIGTPSYMAPEQALGAGKSAGAAADVYSLGAILYDCLTGRPPFQGASILETLEQVRLREPAPPRELNSSIPADLETICLKCLRKEPDKRYTSAGDLADDLRHYLTGRPIRARPVGTLERNWKRMKRHPVEAGLSTAVVLLLAALAIGALVKNAELSQALTRSDEAKIRSDQAKVHSDEATNQATARLWESLRDRARAVRMSRAPGQRLESIRSIREALALPTPPEHSVDELRTEAIAALALPDLERLREWEGYPTGTIAVDFDGTIERYARLGSDGAVSVRRVSDDTLIAGWREPTNGPWPSGDTNLRFSRDGRCLCVLQPVTGRLVVRRIEGGGEFVCPDRCPWVSMDFSPDSKRLAYLVPDGRIAVVTLFSQEVRYLKATGAENQASVRFSPEGRRFALVVNRAGKWSIEVRDTTTGTVQQVLPDLQGACNPAWHPNGQLLAAGGDDQLIRIWDVQSGKVIQKLEGHKNLGINCAFDRTGNHLLSNDWSGLLRLWELSSGKQLLSLRTLNYNFLRIGPDGRIPALSALDQTRLQVWRAQMGSAYRTIVLGDADSIAKIDIKGSILFKVHPRGRLLAAATVRNTVADSVAIVDLAAGQLVARLKAGTFVPSVWDGPENLLTCGPAGLLRWPLCDDADEPGHYRFGPPTRLLEDYADADAEIGISADTQTVAIPAGDRGAVLVHRGPPTQRYQLQPQQDVRSCSVSPDGRWVASGSHSNSDGLGAIVWNAHDGELVQKLPVSGLGRVVFSPDGRWLLTTGGGCRLWKAGAWDKPCFVGGAIGCFSPNSGVLALDDSAGAIRLVSTATGNTLLRLEAPEQANLLPRGFTPDGAKLLAVGVDTAALHVWDLRAIRKELLELDLASGLPEYPAIKETALQSIRVNVVPEAKSRQQWKSD